MEIKEVWKDIEGYEELYQISNFGNVKSLHFNHSSYSKLLTNRIVNEGYCQVVLYKNKIRKAFYIHVLVANAFIPNPLNLPEVNHKDGNKINNHISNLEWVTSQENSIHAVETGLRTVPKGSEHYRSKKINQFDKSRNFIKTWDSMCEISRVLGYATSNIFKCCNNQIKSAYGYIWEYVEVVL